MIAIQVDNLSKRYADVRALNQVSFSVSGGIFGIIGADGAGKTTLLRILTTLIQPDSGTVSILNNSIKDNIHKIRSIIGYMPQRFSLYQDLSVKENLSFFADVFGVSGKERNSTISRLLSFSRLDKFEQRRAANLSGGMKQKLALCCALVHKPRILLLDEPTTGVDPVSRREFRDILLELKNQEITIIVSTPYMDETDMCDYLMILHKGKILQKGKLEELLKQFPYSLYRIGSTEQTIYCPRDYKLPNGIHMMYPCAGMVHLMVDEKLITSEKVNAFAKKEFPYADIIEKVSPGIEDLFFNIVN